ncbi:MAG: hypothetical protein LBL66_01905 [Clostridiales bacterium]|jgi:hypothetical protein|nr:hypothetical protein [Clostridiales bacterium]
MTRNKKLKVFGLTLAIAMLLVSGGVVLAAWIIHGASNNNSVTIGGAATLEVGQNVVFTDVALDGDSLKSEISTVSVTLTGTATYKIYISEVTFSSGSPTYADGDLYIEYSDTDSTLTASATKKLAQGEEFYTGLSAGKTFYIRVCVNEDATAGIQALAGQTVTFKIATGA